MRLAQISIVGDARDRPLDGRPPGFATKAGNGLLAGRLRRDRERRRAATAPTRPL